MNSKRKKVPIRPGLDPNKVLQEGIRLQCLGEIDKARQIFTDLIGRYPNQISLHNRLGQLCFIAGELDNAASYFKSSLEINPDQADIIANLGVVYRRLKLYDLALECQQKSLAINPDHPNAYNNLGILYHEAYKRNSDAIQAFTRAILLKPDFPDAHYNLGNVYKSQQAFDQALDCYKKAIALNPNYGSAIANLAIVLGAKKKYDSSLDYYHRAIELGVEINFLYGQYVYTKLHTGEWSDFDSHLNKMRDEILDGKPAAAPFATLALFDDPMIQQRAIQTFKAIEFPEKSELPEPNVHPEHNRIRLGYFSSDYWNHPVAHLMLGLFAAHDRQRFEVIAFSIGKPINDKWRKRVQDSCDQFIDVADLSDLEVAKLARSMEIDIAIDLNGYTENCRAGIFAYGAAPVQCSYIGYLGTMAASYIHYLITDQTIVPESSRQFYSEKMIYLPTYQCNDPNQQPSERSVSRNEFGLPESAFVFCAFNNNYKIMPNVFDIWMRILKRVPNGVLWLFVNNARAQENLRAAACALKVDPDRLVFAKKVALEDHLARQRLGDLFLDTLPYNAGATASNALRVGLPVLTRTGNSFAGRMGTSLLRAVNMPELVTSSAQEYEDRAVELAHDTDQMHSIREKLRQNLKNSALFNNQDFARNIETAFATIHQRACNKLAPMHLLVK